MVLIHDGHIYIHTSALYIYMIHTSINLEEHQEAWVKDNHINLSSMVRAFIDSKIEQSAVKND